MSDEFQQTKQPCGQEDAILPGLGIVAGILIGVVLWTFVEDWLNPKKQTPPGILSLHTLGA